MSKLRFSAASLLLAALSFSCGDSGSAGGGSIPVDELPAKYATAVCTALQNCIGPAAFSLFLGGANCVDLTTKRLENGTFALMQQKITAGTIRYDGNKAQACFDALSGLTCDGLLQRDQPACLAALDGVVALGGDCDINEECAGSAICQSSTGACPGKCVALLSAGLACSADGDCASGLQCSSETSLCVSPAVVGDANMDRHPAARVCFAWARTTPPRHRPCVAAPPTPSALPRALLAIQPREFSVAQGFPASRTSTI